jgi:hypothetical protein
MSEHNRNTWFERRGKKRMGKLDILDTPFERDQAVQGAFGDGELTNQHEAQYLNDHGTPLDKNRKPESEVTAGGNS